MNEQNSPYTTVLQPDRCPHCAARLDAAAHMTEDVRPKPGNWSICMYCVQVSVFDDRLLRRPPEPAELEAAFRENPDFADEVRRIQRAVRATDRRDAAGPRL